MKYDHLGDQYDPARDAWQALMNGYTVRNRAGDSELDQSLALRKRVRGKRGTREVHLHNPHRRQPASNAASAGLKFALSAAKYSARTP